MMEMMKDIVRWVWSFLQLITALSYIPAEGAMVGELKPINVYGKSKFIDLTYAFNNDTVVFPGKEKFVSFNTEIEGYTPNGVWIVNKGFCASEHTSTHIDSPWHFYKDGRKLHEIPLDDLIDIPGIMIDMYDKVHKLVNGAVQVDENYALTQEDVMEWEEKHGQIPPRSIILLRSGWQSRWPNSKLFRGSKSDKAQTVGGAGDLDLNFPGFALSAAKYLAVERQVIGVGVDTLSIDPGNQSKLFPAHVTFAERQIWMLEVVANLHLLPPRGFNLWVVPFKIDSATGAPTRVIAKLNN